MITNRQKLILKAVIESYNRDGLPIGSSSITDFPYLSKSGATIRADLASLEKDGFIQKTHTSSGRIPTNKGYKFYIENLLSTNKLDEELLNKIDEAINNKISFRKDAITNLITQLSDFTQSRILVFGPDVTNHYIFDCSVLLPNEKVAVMQVTTSSGLSVAESIVLNNDINIEELQSASIRFTEIFKGRLISEVLSILDSDKFICEIKTIINNCTTFLKFIKILLTKLITVETYEAGTIPFISTQLKDLITNAQLNKDIKLPHPSEIKDLVTIDNNLTIRIDDELPFLLGYNCVLISVPIKINDSEKGTICVLGHKRLNYEVVVPLLEYASLQITKLYK